MKESTMSTIAVILSVLTCCIVSYVVGYTRGEDSGARQMARHVLNPAFRTDEFDILIDEEADELRGWRVEDGIITFFKEGTAIVGSSFSDMDGNSVIKFQGE